MNTILNLTLKKKWFDMILSGEKKEEYREIKPYFEKRLLQCNSDLGTIHSKYQCKKQQCERCILEHNGGEFKQFEFIIFKNGYAKKAPEILIECKGIHIGFGSPCWGANEFTNYFVIKLGKIIKTNNLI